MTINEAIQTCRATGLTGWELVAYAQQLVHKTMKYSVNHSFDQPPVAFEKGRGYCWQQASALNAILRGLGLDSRLVFSTKAVFPEVVIAGAAIQNFVSGHVWCRVRVDGQEKDVCPGGRENAPDVLHFRPLHPVREWNKGVEFVTYYGSALLNYHRGKKYSKRKAKEENRWNPALCPCKKTTCPRYRQCEECKAFHYANGGLPACER